MIRHAIIPALLFTCGASVVGTAQDPVRFAERVRPLLNRHCVACHGGVKQAAGVSFVYEDGLRDLVVPGNADDSYLIERVTDPDPESRMPPAEHGPRLSDDELAVLRDWINQGASWEPHWAYLTPHRTTRPNVSDPAWCHQPLDYFVLARLDEEGHAPAPTAPAESWLRRVTLDLLGLPPSPAQRAMFLTELREGGERAYHHAVDRLLASPHFGERWAAVWFDQVRYADSQGLGVDGNRTIWKYRDWVIRAFNDDLPFDQFTIKQIAGDLLPQATLSDHVATAVHRLTQTNEEGGTDDEEFRIAAVLDRVRTVCQTWQGTSIGCVQCHSHPYDPIRHEEFYQLVALFNNTVDSDTGDDWPWVPVPVDDADLNQGEELWQRSRELQRGLWALETKVAHEDRNWQPATRLKVEGNAQLKVEQNGPEEQFFLEGNPRERLEIRLTLPVSEPTVTGVRLNVLPLDPDSAAADSEWGFVLRHITLERIPQGSDTGERIAIAHVVGDDPFPRWPPTASLQEEGSEGYAAYTRIHQRRRVAFVFDQPVVFHEGDELRLSLYTHRHHAGTHPLIIKRGSLELCSDPNLGDALDSPALNELRDELAQATRRLRQIDCIQTPVLRERPAHLRRPTHQFIRGLFLTKGPEVSGGVPDTLPSRS